MLRILICYKYIAFNQHRGCAFSFNFWKSEAVHFLTIYHNLDQLDTSRSQVVKNGNQVGFDDRVINKRTINISTFFCLWYIFARLWYILLAKETQCDYSDNIEGW